MTYFSQSGEFGSMRGSGFGTSGFCAFALLRVGSLSSESLEFVESLRLRSFLASFRAASRMVDIASRSAFFLRSMSLAAIDGSMDSSCSARAAIARSRSFGFPVARSLSRLSSSLTELESAGGSAVGVGGGIVGSGNADGVGDWLSVDAVGGFCASAGGISGKLVGDRVGDAVVTANVAMVAGVFSHRMDPVFRFLGVGLRGGLFIAVD